MARWLSYLLNKPSADDDGYFHKVDCGKLSDAAEIFGKSGYWQGAEQGSSLNNFVHRMSIEDNRDSIGVVLLDEIENADRDVIHALYQVLDKGEWTNKKLSHDAQSETIPCHNIIFIMTTNACDQVTNNYVSRDKDKEVYLASSVSLGDVGEELEEKLLNSLQQSHPFTNAFIGRIDRVVPFLPMAKDNTGSHHTLLGEMMTIAKILIEREQEKFDNSTAVNVTQEVDPETKHDIATIVVKKALPESGVRSIQKLVQKKMSVKLMHSVLLKKGGIQKGSTVQYQANEDERTIDFRTKKSGTTDTVDEDEGDYEDVYA